MAVSLSQKISASRRQQQIHHRPAMPTILAMFIQRPGNLIRTDRQDRQQGVAQTMTCLAEALHIDAGLAAFVGDQFVAMFHD